ncbi:Coq4 family protein [Eleftheria terrae]|uniref:Coq4 family protein n=1 Tax=Eleftheria terrae TaxID=1597781 RepID=UPI00263AE689|nr:Coq4 family protein [Eleftheria terrae]
MRVAHPLSRPAVLPLSARLNRARLWAVALFKCWRRPFSVPALSALSRAVRSGRAHRDAVQYMLSDPRVAELCRQRYTGGSSPPGALLCQPPGSLGHEVAVAVLASPASEAGWREPLEPDAAQAGEDDYLAGRVRQLHEVAHVLTGFAGNEVAGALGLQAFWAAQTRRPFSIALLALGLLRTLARPAELPRTLSQIAKGWLLGFAAQPLLAQRFEDDWARPVEQWRRELGLVHERSLDLRNTVASMLRPLPASAAAAPASSRPKR